MQAPSQDRLSRLDTLRDEIRVIKAFGKKTSRNVLPFGIAEMDRRVGKGGLQQGALHDFAGGSRELADDAAATLFMAGIAARASSKGGMVLWAFRWRDLFAPALAQVGLSPHRLIQAECGRDEDVLTVMEEGLRHGGLAAVIGETNQVAMPSTRRLQLAAEESGTMAMMLRKGRKAGMDPLHHPSVAVTRWKIGCVPAAPLPVQGVGRPRWSIELVRQRGGEPCQWIMEGCDAEGRLALPAGPANRSAAADRGTGRQAA